MKVTLGDIAYARSGDKGPDSNIGVIFKTAEDYNWALDVLTPEVVRKYFGDIVKGDVVRYELPNLNALNFILLDSLGGGGSQTLINDAQGKTYGQAILMIELER